MISQADFVEQIDCGEAQLCQMSGSQKYVWYLFAWRDLASAMLCVCALLLYAAGLLIVTMQMVCFAYASAACGVLGFLSNDFPRTKYEHRQLSAMVNEMRLAPKRVAREEQDETERIAKLLGF